MAARVLSPDQAKTAIQQVQQIVNGSLTEQISKEGYSASVVTI